MLGRTAFLTLVAALALVAAPVATAEHCTPPPERECGPNGGTVCEEVVAPTLNEVARAIYTACELLPQPD